MKKSLCIVALFTNLSIIIHAQKEIIADAPTIFSSSNTDNSKQMNENIKTIADLINTDLVNDAKEEKSHDPVEIFTQVTPDIPAINPLEEEQEEDGEFHDAVESFTKNTPDISAISHSFTTATPKATHTTTFLESEFSKKNDDSLKTDNVTIALPSDNTLKSITQDLPVVKSSTQNEIPEIEQNATFSKTKISQENDTPSPTSDLSPYTWEHPYLQHLEYDTSRIQKVLQYDDSKKLFSTLFPQDTQQKLDEIIYALQNLKVKSTRFQVEILKNAPNLSPVIIALIYTIFYYDLRTLQDYKNYLFSQMGLYEAYYPIHMFNGVNISLNKQLEALKDILENNQSLQFLLGQPDSETNMLVKYIQSSTYITGNEFLSQFWASRAKNKFIKYLTHYISTETSKLLGGYIFGK